MKSYSAERAFSRFASLSMNGKAVKKLPVQPELVERIVNFQRNPKLEGLYG